MNRTENVLFRKPRRNKSDLEQKTSVKIRTQPPLKRPPNVRGQKVHPKLYPDPSRSQSIRLPPLSRRLTQQVQNVFLTQLPPNAPNQDFLVSKKLRISDACVDRKNFYNAHKSTSEHNPTGLPQAIRSIQMEPDLPDFDRRAPLLHSLIEVAREIKVALEKAHHINIECVVQQMPKYDPSVPLRCGPRHEIIVMELGDNSSGDKPGPIR
ncbi:unnamed protein product [Echinostoma caproni]|uniref:Uncharacterized protein n=1 Tax=Echinostoma caproni TaxID=27848 RepID=A0A183AHS8_9TREM|nr:unnamed protein product [Echinostoma caproni]